MKASLYEAVDTFAIYNSLYNNLKNSCDFIGREL
jgi:hypothetical protein